MWVTPPLYLCSTQAIFVLLILADAYQDYFKDSNTRWNQFDRANDTAHKSVQSSTFQQCFLLFLTCLNLPLPSAEVVCDLLCLMAFFRYSLLPSNELNEDKEGTSRSSGSKHSIFGTTTLLLISNVALAIVIVVLSLKLFQPSQDGSFETGFSTEFSRFFLCHMKKKIAEYVNRTRASRCPVATNSIYRRSAIRWEWYAV